MDSLVNVISVEMDNVINDSTVEEDAKPHPSLRICSDFTMLGGNSKFILLTYVFPYLTAKEMCILGQCAKSLLRMTEIDTLWLNLINKDFMYETDGSDAHTSDGSIIVPMTDSHESTDEMILTPPSSSSSSSSSKHSKLKYIKKLTELQRRIIQKEDDNNRYKIESQLDLKRIKMENLLDLTQIRCMIPLPATTSFISLLLLSLRCDGYPISTWFCATPTLFFLLYILFGLYMTHIVYTNQFVYNSVWYNLWTNFRGPFRVYYSIDDSNFRQKLSFYILLFLICLFTLQILLLTIKVSITHQPESIYQIPLHLPWTVTFLPIWCILALYLCSPCLSLMTDSSLYLLGLFFIWIPAVIVTIGIVIKLSQNDREIQTSQHPSLRLAYIFIPFWFFEGIIMLGSLVLLIDGYARVRAGILEKINDHLGVFVLCWLLTSPFVIFQALISAYDDGYNINHTNTCIPLLIVIAVAILLTVSIAIKIKTLYQNFPKQCHPHYHDNCYNCYYCNNMDTTI